MAALTGAHRASADTFAARGDVTANVGQQFTVTFEVDDNGFDPNFCTAGTTVSVTFGGVPGPFSPVGSTDTTTDCSPNNPTVSITLVGTGPGTGTIYVSIGSIRSGSVIVTIRAPNSAPTISGGNTIAKSTAEDTPLDITIAATDADSDPLTYTVASGPSHGTLSGTGATRTYSPTANYNGSDQYTVTVTDGYGGSVTATVNLTITAVNDLPVANPDIYTTAEDTPLSIPAPGFLANDTDVEGNPVSVYRYNYFPETLHGQLTISSANGAFTYTPDPNFAGTATFNYQVTDNGGSDGPTTTVIVNVTSVNDPPTATNDTLASSAEDQVRTIPGNELTGNDSPGPSEQTRDTIAVTAVDQVTGGSAVVSSGSVVFTPTPDSFGPASFRYTITDGEGLTATATVAFTVTAVNDTPVASPQSVSTVEDTATTITLSGTDIDTATGSLTYAVASSPVHGTLSSVAGDQVTYTPVSNYSDADSFTFTVSDGTTTSQPATVTIIVTPVNDAPVLANLPADIGPVEATGAGGALVPFTPPTATDPDGGTPTVTCAAGSTAVTSPAQFTIGTSTVTCTGSDVVPTGTETLSTPVTDSFTVTVVDTTAPTVTVPANITAEATSSAGAVVTYTATATDLVDGPVTPVCTLASGSTFPIGTTTVSCTATDSRGNTSSVAIFTITVRDTSGPTITFVGGPQPNQTYTLTNLPAEPTCTATDTSSPVVQCRVYGYSTAPGSFTLTARARDTEGNATVSTRTYTVTASAPTTTPRPATTTPRPATATPRPATATPSPATATPPPATAVPPQPTAVPTRAPRPTATPVTPSVPTAAPTRAPRG